jgi:hypothetical protein
MVGEIAAAAAAAVSAAINAAKIVAKVSSPSRVMRDEVGKMLGLGAALGVEDMVPRMQTAMSRLVQMPQTGVGIGSTVAPLAVAGAGLGLMGAGGGPTIIHEHNDNRVYQILDPEEWAKLLTDTKASREFLEGLARAREIKKSRRRT